MNLHRADVNQESGPSCLPTMIEKTHLQKAHVGLTNDDCVVGPPMEAARTPESALILRRDGMRECQRACPSVTSRRQCEVGRVKETF